MPPQDIYIGIQLPLTNNNIIRNRNIRIEIE